ncbi:MAG TPA: hypothetical protein VIP11_01380 [Gemmatimonadaceae bacterium]
MSRHRSLTTAVAVLLFASPLAAQRASSDTSTVSVTSTAAAVVAHSAPDSLLSLSPTWAPAWTVGPGAHANTTLVPVRRLLEPRSSESTAMMIVGGAGLVVGAIVGGKSGTTLMVGGGILGLVGLWSYLR